MLKTVTSTAGHRYYYYIFNALNDVSLPIDRDSNPPKYGLFGIRMQ